MRRAVSIVTLAAALAASCAGPAEALLARAWVSGKGVDAPGCGPVGNPCRKLQYVHDNIVAAGGEIDILDPAGYGALNITKSLSVVNEGSGVAGVLQSAELSDGVRVQAGSGDVVHLRGLTIDGFGVAQYGISFFSGAALEIVSCTIRNFQGGGLHLRSNNDSKIAILDTIVADNQSAGVLIAAAGAASVQASAKGLQVVGTTLGSGVVVTGGYTDPSKTVDAVIVDSTASGNAGAGFATTGAGRQGGARRDSHQCRLREQWLRPQRRRRRNGAPVARDRHGESLRRLRRLFGRRNDLQLWRQCRGPQRNRQCGLPHASLAPLNAGGQT